MAEAARSEIAKLERAERKVLVDANLTIIQQDREVCKSFGEFVRSAWHVLEPETPYVEGWHIDAICQHLEAVTWGYIQHLLANVSPGSMKSLLFSVFWPAWEWGPVNRPHLTYMSGSYEQTLAHRDNRRMRRLVSSEWYQARWPLELTKTGDELFENAKGGERRARAFNSMTGGRANRLIIDDPHSVATAESDTERESTVRTFRESITDRLRDQAKDSIVIIMQRLHVADISGTIRDLKLPYEFLMIPMEYDPDRAFTTSIGWKDPRTKRGELMCPARWPQKVIDDLKLTKGSYAWAGQYDQSPTLREGGMFKRENFRIVEAFPAATRWVRFWDIAATSDQMGADPAYTAGVKLGRQPDGRFIIGDVNRLRAEGNGVRRMIKETAKADGVHVEIGLPQDPGAAGKIVAQDMLLMLAGYIVSAAPESGDKVQRASPVAAQAEAGNIDLIKGDWNEAFLSEASDFPGGKHKDQIDALSGAFAKLIGATVFDVSEEYIAMEAVKVKAIWPRVGAIWISREKFTAVWLATDLVSDTVYIYDALVVPRQDMAIHANALRKKGPWVPMLFDPEAAGRKKEEGIRLAQALDELGIPIFAVKFDEGAAMEVLGSRLNISSLWVFDHLLPWFAAYRRLTRNEKGEIVGDDTGVFHATGLALHSGLEIAITENRAESDAQGMDPSVLDRNSVTGY